jgi:hypothetical protein
MGSSIQQSQLLQRSLEPRLVCNNSMDEMNWNLNLFLTLFTHPFPAYEQIPDQCLADTADLNNLPELIYATVEVQQWVDTLMFEDIYSYPSPDRLQCVIDYSWDHNMMEVCHGTGGIYVTAEYIIRCDHNDYDSTLFYTTKAFPACVASSCGIDGAKAVQEEGVDAIQSALEENDQACRRLRLNIIEEAPETVSASI